MPVAVEIWIWAERCKKTPPCPTSSFRRANLPAGEELEKCGCYICSDSTLRLAYFQLSENIHRSESPFNYTS